MTNFIQLVFQGVSLGAIYALLALGFVVVFRPSRIINFAQGAMLLVGAYLVSYFTVSLGMPFLLAAVLSCALLSIAAVVFYSTILRGQAGRDPFVAIMITIGMGIAAVAIIEAVFGSQQRLLGDPWGSSSLTVGAYTINWIKVWTLGTAVAALAVYFVFDRYTRYGLAVRATASDEEAASAVGVPVRRVHAITWAIAGTLAVLAGIFLAGFPNAPQPALGDAALRAFPAVILGGLQSASGAIVGGLTIGLIEMLVAGYSPDWAGANAYSVAPYLVMMLVLLVKPYGLFGSRPVARV